MKLSIIIVNWNTARLLVQCIQSIDACRLPFAYEICVVDNASTDDSLQRLRLEFETVRVIANATNVGFAIANNQALAQLNSQYYLLLNSDTLVRPGSIEALVQLADSHPRLGMAGAQLLNPDGSFQNGHTHFPDLGQEFLVLSGLGRLIYGSWYPSSASEETKGPQVVEYLSGACLLVRREAYLEVGGLDEHYFMYAEEMDWCLAMRKAGWQVWYEPKATLIHLGGASSATRRPQRELDLYSSRVRFFRKHYGRFQSEILKLLIYSFTLLKIVGHGLLGRVSGGRYGRPVVSFRALVAQLEKI